MQTYKIRKNLNEEERKMLSAHDPILSHLLYHRGIIDNESVENFIEPNYDEQSYDPYLLKDARKSALRIIEAIKSGQKIAIYADYDADGIPGASLWHSFFSKIGYKNFVIYIPHRHDEGFGLNIEAVEQLANEKVDLIVTVDCGITDILPAKKAKDLGVDLIITDHHEPKDILPEAYAIIDHKQKDCNYPDKNICGSGVAYKLIQAILKTDRLGLSEGHEKWFLDLVGIATLSDMVPLTGENRIFAYYGLKVLRKSHRLGLVQLLKKLKINQRYINEDDIGYMITPRINAASRMGLPMDAFHLLTAENEIDAEKYADHLDKINNERKGVVASLIKEVKKNLHQRYGDNLPNVLVIGNPEWRPSLLGLVANTCAEEFNRPAFFWGRDGGNIIKGSCRSPKGFSLVEIMKNCPTKTFLQFGGHHQSGGFSVANEEIHFLENRLIESSENLHNKNRQTEEDEKDYIDLEISLDEIDENFVEKIIKLGPFGVGNPRPVFLTKNLFTLTIKKFGKKSEHIELKFKLKNRELSAISFFGGNSKWAESIGQNKKIDLVYSIEKSHFRGRPEIRLRILDLIVY